MCAATRALCLDHFIYRTLGSNCCVLLPQMELAFSSMTAALFLADPKESLEINVLCRLRRRLAAVQSPKQKFNKIVMIGIVDIMENVGMLYFLYDEYIFV